MPPRKDFTNAEPIIPTEPAPPVGPATHRIEAPILGRRPVGAERRPTITYPGTAVPNVGDHLEIAFPNGSTYDGTVEAAVEIAGMVLVDLDATGMRPR